MDRTELKPYVSEYGRFSVMLPAKVGKQSETVSTKMGDIYTTQYNARAKYIQFTIVHLDYPDEYMQNTNPATILEAAPDDIAARLGGKVKKKTKFIQNDVAVHDARIKAQKGLWVRSRVLLSGNRMYQLMAFCTKRHAREKKIDEVFDSFTILQPDPDTEPSQAPEAEEAADQSDE